MVKTFAICFLKNVSHYFDYHIFILFRKMIVIFLQNFPNLSMVLDYS